MFFSLGEPLREGPRGGRQRLSSSWSLLDLEGDTAVAMLGEDQGHMGPRTPCCPPSAVVEECPLPGLPSPSPHSLSHSGVT